MTKREAYLLAGPTASGKSAAAAILARARGAAILSADSMLVYRGMDLGTAKPSREEREEFCMGGVDIVTPAEHFSSGAWLRAAAEWLAALPADRPVVVVGGTGLYFSALLRGLDRVPQDLPVGVGPGCVGRKHDAFRHNLMSFVSIVLCSLIVFAEQLFAALVGRAGHSGLAFAALPVGNTEMGARDGCIISCSRHRIRRRIHRVRSSLPDPLPGSSPGRSLPRVSGVAGLPAQGPAPDDETPAGGSSHAGAVPPRASQSAISTGTGG